MSDKISLKPRNAKMTVTRLRQDINEITAPFEAEDTHARRYPQPFTDKQNSALADLKDIHFALGNHQVDHTKQCGMALPLELLRATAIIENKHIVATDAMKGSIAAGMLDSGPQSLNRAVILFKANDAVYSMGADGRTAHWDKTDLDPLSILLWCPYKITRPLKGNKNKVLVPDPKSPPSSSWAIEQWQNLRMPENGDAKDLVSSAIAPFDYNKPGDEDHLAGYDIEGVYFDRRYIDPYLDDGWQYKIREDKNCIFLKKGGSYATIMRVHLTPEERIHS